MCCGSTRQKGRVKNRRNSDRIGWNSMWDNATRLNNQSLSSLGVHSGGLIHCAVRIRPAQPRPALDRKAAHAPHPGEAVSTLHARLLPIHTGTNPTPNCVPAMCAPCHLQARPLRGDHIHQAFAAYVHGELVDIIWDQEWLGTPDANEGKTYPSSFANLSAGMCAPRPIPPEHTQHPALRLPPDPSLRPVPYVGPDAAAPVPPAQVRLSHHDNAPALRHACGAGVLVRRRPDPLAPGHLVAVVPPHGGARRHARRLPRADRSERRRHLATDSSPCVDACPLDATPPYPHHGTPHPVLPKPHPA